jgi:hypothetical protein
MKKSKKYTATEILKSQTPEEYVDRCVNSKLSRAEKTALTHQWTRKTSFTVSDIQHARNRHPHWKEKKLEGNLERTARRFSKHNYFRSSSRKKWEFEKIQQFMEFNTKDNHGKYRWKDWQIAKRLGTSIPSVQYWRRKRNMIARILGKSATPNGILEYICASEKYLREDLNKKRKKRA